MSFKPIEPRRDEFRKYLERCGIIEALSKVLCKLLDEEEKPEDPLNYIRENIGDKVLQVESTQMLQSELLEAKKEIDQLKTLINQQNFKLEQIPQARESEKKRSDGDN